MGNRGSAARGGGREMVVRKAEKKATLEDKREKIKETKG